MKSTAEAFTHLYEVVQRLRSDDGCPWDREQTPESLRGALIEETYECIEAIDAKDTSHVKEELGDIFLLATMISYMYEQVTAFTVTEVLEEISNKLIRRHPHVFGDSEAATSAEVLEQWARIKVEQEGRRPKDSIMDQVSRALPPLDRAYKLQKKAAKVGFDWPDVTGVWEKIEEELAEARDACLFHQKEETQENREHLEEELGDLLFSVVNICRYLHVDPSVALQRTNTKFVERFKQVEQNMKAHNLPMDSDHIDQMERFWQESKT
ncbi:MAG: nucleoside triphosphate pyrophosphohydrolase [Termitinemataceae bacterium]